MTWSGACARRRRVAMEAENAERVRMESGRLRFENGARQPRRRAKDAEGDVDRARVRTRTRTWVTCACD